MTSLDFDLDDLLPNQRNSSLVDVVGGIVIPWVIVSNAISLFVSGRPIHQIWVTCANLLEIRAVDLAPIMLGTATLLTTQLLIAKYRPMPRITRSLRTSGLFMLVCGLIWAFANSACIR